MDQLDSEIVRELIKYDRAELKQNVAQSILKERYHRTRQRLARERLLIVLGLIGLVVAWIWLRVSGMRSKFEEHFAVMETARFERGAAPKGLFRYSMWDIALVIEYPALHTLGNTLGLSDHLSRAGALFLASILYEFRFELTRVHWSGSASQLRLELLPYFATNFSTWRDRRNPFRFLFGTELHFEESIMMCRYRQLGLVSELHSLFDGGFCNLARLMADAESLTYTDLLRRVLGRNVIFKQSCHDEKVQAATFTVSNVVATGAGLFGVGAALAGVAAVATPVGALATLALAAGTAGASFELGRRSYDGAMCTFAPDQTMVSGNRYRMRREGGGCGEGTPDVFVDSSDFGGVATDPVSGITHAANGATDALSGVVR